MSFIYPTLFEFYKSSTSVFLMESDIHKNHFKHSQIFILFNFLIKSQIYQSLHFLELFCYFHHIKIMISNKTKNFFLSIYLYLFVLE